MDGEEVQRAIDMLNPGEFVGLIDKIPALRVVGLEVKKEQRKNFVVINGEQVTTPGQVEHSFSARERLK